MINGMRVAFGSIFLNESQFLPASLKQHYEFCDKWFLVEGADVRYPNKSVSESGLSTDESASIVYDFPDPDKKLQLIEHGWASDKCALRNRYATLADDFDILVVIDIDEFMTHASMKLLLDVLSKFNSPGTFRVPHAHFWKSQSHIVTGMYWDTPHDRAYRWEPGNRYKRDHNHPEKHGVLLRDQHCVQTSRSLVTTSSGVKYLDPVWLHYANCKDLDTVRDKNDYYLSRGEAVTRPRTIESREALFKEQLPRGLQVHKWSGEIPEVFR